MLVRGVFLKYKWPGHVCHPPTCSVDWHLMKAPKPPASFRNTKIPASMCSFLYWFYSCSNPRLVFTDGWQHDSKAFISQRTAIRRGNVKIFVTRTQALWELKSRTGCVCSFCWNSSRLTNSRLAAGIRFFCLLENNDYMLRHVTVVCGKASPINGLLLLLYCGSTSDKCSTTVLNEEFSNRQFPFISFF